MTKTTARAESPAPFDAAPAEKGSINLRIDTSTRALINEAAAMLGKTRTDFMIDTARRQAIDVLLEHVRMQLNRNVDSSMRRFVIHCCHQMMEGSMVLALSMDIRTRVAAALEDGGTVRAAAKWFGVSVASAVRIGQRHRAGRGQSPGKIGGHRRPVLAGVAGDWLLARLAEKPDLTMRALTAELAGRGVHVAHDTVWRFVRRAGQSVKKNADGQ